MIAIVVLVIIAVIGWAVFSIVSLKKEQHDTLKEQEELKQEKEQLEQELENINDAENLEEQARSQLRLIKPGEILYMFPEEITNSDDSDGTQGNEDSDQE